MAVSYASQPGGLVSRTFAGNSGAAMAVTRQDVTQNLQTLQIFDTNSRGNADLAADVANVAAGKLDTIGAMKENVAADIAARAETSNKFAAANPMAQLNGSGMGFMTLASTILPIPDFGAFGAAMAMGRLGLDLEGQGSHVTMRFTSSQDLSNDDDGDGQVSQFEQGSVRMVETLNVGGVDLSDPAFTTQGFADGLDAELGAVDGMLHEAERRASVEYVAAETVHIQETGALSFADEMEGLNADTTLTRGVADGYSPPTGEFAMDRRAMPQPGLG
jgi:hypothetical protein